MCNLRMLIESGNGLVPKLTRWGTLWQSDADVWEQGAARERRRDSAPTKRSKLPDLTRVLFRRSIVEPTNKG